MYTYCCAGVIAFPTVQSCSIREAATVYTKSVPTCKFRHKYHVKVYICIGYNTLLTNTINVIETD
jgi:hypothetical protein